jgi:uncharacterized protein (TIGR00251 family)
LGIWTSDVFRNAVIEHSDKNGKLAFKVQVVPRASRSEIVGEHNGALRVRIAALPVDGAANEELIRIMARTFKVSRSAIRITGGQTSKLKQISVTGATPDALALLSRSVSG